MLSLALVIGSDPLINDQWAAGSDGELERSAVACESGQPVHGRPHNFGCEHAGARRVIGLRGLGVPNLFLPHPANDRHRAAPCPTNSAARRALEVKVGNGGRTGNRGSRAGCGVRLQAPLHPALGVSRIDVCEPYRIMVRRRQTHRPTPAASAAHT